MVVTIVVCTAMTIADTTTLLLSNHKKLDSQKKCWMYKKNNSSCSWFPYFSHTRTNCCMVVAAAMVRHECELLMRFFFSSESSHNILNSLSSFTLFWLSCYGKSLIIVKWLFTHSLNVLAIEVYVYIWKSIKLTCRHV